MFIDEQNGLLIIDDYERNNNFRVNYKYQKVNVRVSINSSFCRTSQLHSQIILALWRCQSTESLLQNCAFVILPEEPMDNLSSGTKSNSQRAPLPKPPKVFLLALQLVRRHHPILGVLGACAEGQSVTGPGDTCQVN